MACGVPLVCHSWGGTKELVGDTGISLDGPAYVYDEALAKNAADALLILLKDQDRFSVATRERTEKLFNIELMTEQYLNVMEKENNSYS